MPWPLVPPDADFPSPSRRDPDHDWFATRVEMTGLVPYKEQGSLRISVAGKAAALWLPVQRSMGTHHYAGVVLSTLGGDTLDAEWLANGGRTRKYPWTVKPVTTQDAQIKTAQVHATASKIEVNVVATGQTNGAHAVVAPFTEKMPQMSDLAAYRALGGWAPLSSNKASVQLTRHPDIKTFAVFVALGVPDKIYPISGVKLVEG